MLGVPLFVGLLVRFLDLVVVCLQQTLGSVDVAQRAFVPSAAHILVCVVSCIVEQVIKVWIIERNPNGFAVTFNNLAMLMLLHAVVVILDKHPRQTNKTVFVMRGGIPTPVCVCVSHNV